MEQNQNGARDFAKGAALISVALVSIAAIMACSGSTGVDSQYSFVPPVGADEPVFDAGADVSLFYENFESYANLAEVLSGAGDYDWGWRGKLAQGTQATLLTSGGVDAGKNLQLDYTPDPAVVGEYSMRMFPSVDFVELTKTVDPIIFTMGFKNTGGHHTEKRIAWFPDGPDLQRRFMFGPMWARAWPDELRNCWWQSTWPHSPIDPNETPPYRKGYSFDINERPESDLATYTANINYPAWQAVYENENDGNWHRHTWRITRESAVPGTGRVEMWLDGHKILEYIGDDPLRCEYGRVYTTAANQALLDNQSFELGQTTSGAGSLNGGGYLHYDAIRMWTEPQ